VGVASSTGDVRQTTRKTLSAAVVADRYRLQHEMARGGMGTVWLARDVKLGRNVAVKVMSRDLADIPDATQRFEREARAAAQLRSNHIVEVYDYGIQEGLPFIVMELLEGENLGQRIKRLGRMALEDTAGLVLQICRGLNSAHAAGLVHRDLKPSNIFLALRDGGEVVKLLDFGVVKATDIEGVTPEEATLSGMLLGTPQYMSPEQARATRELDQRSDLWSIGVIIFRLLTGHNPFKGESVGDVVLKICSDALPQITDINPSLPLALNPFFVRAFARDPDARFQTADELAASFLEIVTTQTGHGAPVAFGASPAALSNSATNRSRPSFPGAMAPLTPGPHTPGPHTPGPLTPGPLTPGQMAAVPLASGAGAAAGSTPSALTPASFTTSAPAVGIPTPRPGMGSVPGMIGEATPISTTVAGTQLASVWPRPARPLSGQPVALVVAGAAGLITFALVAAIWLGSSPEETAPASQPAARADMDLFSNDDDGPESAAKPSDPPSEGALDDGDDDGADDDGSEPVERGDEVPPPEDSAKPPSTPEPVSPTTSPPPTDTVPVPPRPKSGKDRPDWGLSGK
jgi:eukaryotic-like serine/threonine-protein kinase